MKSTIVRQHTAIPINRGTDKRIYNGRAAGKYSFLLWFLLFVLRHCTTFCIHYCSVELISSKSPEVFPVTLQMQELLYEHLIYMYKASQSTARLGA